MKRLALLAISLLLTSCASVSHMGSVLLSDGSRVEAVEFETVNPAATDLDYILVFHCPEAGDCAKAGEFGGSSAGFAKALFHGAAAGAAIGAGIAVQAPDQTSVSTSVKGVSKSGGGKAIAVGKGGNANALSFSSSKANASSFSKSGSSAFQIQGQQQGQAQGQLQKQSLF